MNRKLTVFILVLLLVGIGVALAFFISSPSSAPAPIEEKPLISGEGFDSPDLKLKEPDPSQEDFKSMRDIEFSDGKK